MGPGEFRQFVGQLRFSSVVRPPRQRECVDGSTSRCPIRITPLIGADSLGTNETQSYVIAKLENLGDTTEARYNIPGNTTAYWLVDVTQARRTRMIVVDTTTGAATALPGDHPFTACLPVDTTRRWRLAADMYGCQSHREAHLTPDLDTVGKQSFNLAAWISCLEGCCTG